MKLFLSYKNNSVQCRAVDDFNVDIFNYEIKSSLQNRDSDKLKAFNKVLRFLSTSGYRGVLDCYLVGRNFQKWVTGVSIPPKNNLKLVLQVRSTLNSCGFDVRFNQVTRVQHEEVKSKEDVNLNILDLISELENED